MIYLDMLRAVKCMIQCSERQQNMVQHCVTRLKKKIHMMYRCHFYVCESMCTTVPGVI